MKTVNIREAQHNLAEILHLVEAGEVVEIRRRTVPIARLVSVREAADGARVSVNWDGQDALMNQVWHGQAIKGVDAVLDDLRDGR
jgi:prevent-host-death family protein